MASPSAASTGGSGGGGSGGGRDADAASSSPSSSSSSSSSSLSSSTSRTAAARPPSAVLSATARCASPRLSSLAAATPAAAPIQALLLGAALVPPATLVALAAAPAATAASEALLVAAVRSLVAARLRAEGFALLGGGAGGSAGGAGTLLGVRGLGATQLDPPAALDAVRVEVTVTGLAPCVVVLRAEGLALRALALTREALENRDLHFDVHAPASLPAQARSASGGGRAALTALQVLVAPSLAPATVQRAFFGSVPPPTRLEAANGDAALTDDEHRRRLALLNIGSGGAGGAGGADGGSLGGALDYVRVAVSRRRLREILGSRSGTFDVEDDDADEDGGASAADDAAGPTEAVPLCLCLHDLRVLRSASRERGPALARRVLGALRAGFESVLWTWDAGEGEDAMGGGASEGLTGLGPGPVLASQTLTLAAPAALPKARLGVGAGASAARPPAARTGSGWPFVGGGGGGGGFVTGLVVAQHQRAELAAAAAAGMPVPPQAPFGGGDDDERGGIGDCATSSLFADWVRGAPVAPLDGPACAARVDWLRARRESAASSALLARLGTSCDAGSTANLLDDDCGGGAGGDWGGGGGGDGGGGGGGQLQLGDKRPRALEVRESSAADRAREREESDARDRGALSASGIADADLFSNLGISERNALMRSLTSTDEGCRVVAAAAGGGPAKKPKNAPRASTAASAAAAGAAAGTGTDAPAAADDPAALVAVVATLLAQARATQGADVAAELRSCEVRQLKAFAKAVAKCAVSGNKGELIARILKAVPALVA